MPSVTQRELLPIVLGANLLKTGRTTEGDTFFKTAGFNRSRTSPLVIATFFRTPDLAVMFKTPLLMPQEYDVTATGGR
jgi:hypothetical protein